MHKFYKSKKKFYKVFKTYVTNNKNVQLMIELHEKIKKTIKYYELIFFSLFFFFV